MKLILFFTFMTLYFIGNVTCKDDEEQIINVTDYKILDSSCRCESASTYRLQATYSCRHYCTCKSNTNQRGKHRTCPKGMVFNQQIENCDYETNFKCLKLPKANNYKCNKYPTDRFPGVCSLYVWCVNRKPITMPCPAGLHYCHSDVCRDNPRCTSRHDANCPFNETSLHEFDCPGDGVFPDPKNCSMFYHCSYGIPYHIACATSDRSAFNSRLGECDYPKNVYCSQDDSVSTTPYSSWACPPGTCEGKEFYPLKNCTKFCHCSGNLGFEKECPYGLHWSVEHNRCEWPCQAKCDQSLDCTLKKLI